MYDIDWCSWGGSERCGLWEAGEGLGPWPWARGWRAPGRGAWAAWARVALTTDDVVHRAFLAI